MQVGTDVFVDPVELLRVERSTGRSEPSDRRQIGLLFGDEPGIGIGGEELGAGSKMGDAGFGGDAPQRSQVGVHRTPVVQNHRRLDGQCADQPVPHHPAAGGEPEDAVVTSDVGVKSELGQMLEQHSAGAVHDAFRWSGGARGVEDEGGLVEGELSKVRQIWSGRCEFLPRQRPGVVGLYPGTNLVDRNHGPEVGDGVEGGADRRPDEVDGAVVAIPIDRDEDLWFDLAEAVDHAAWPEVRRTRRPDCTDGGGGQHRDQSFETVRNESGDAVAGSDSEGQQTRLGASDQTVELGPGGVVSYAVLVDGDDRNAVIATAQQVLGKVEPRPGEPLGSRHRFDSHGSIGYD